jgi:hypothetical protein
MNLAELIGALESIVKRAEKERDEKGGKNGSK